MSSVRPSVCLSVGLMLWISGLENSAERCASVSLAHTFLFVRSDTFAVGRTFSHQMQRKKRVEENANVIF